MLGNIRSSRVLDLGCGFGWFCRWAREEGGASFVKGIDLSENMIEAAKRFQRDDEASNGDIEYSIADLETLSIEREGKKWDVIYSSLAFHYVHDLRRIIREIHGALVDGGRLVFSVEHPIFTAPVASNVNFLGDSPEQKEKVESVRTWPLTSYADEGLRMRTWLNSEGVRKYHRTIETYLSILLEEGFILRGLKEWMPSEELLKEKPEWRGERDRPMFLLIGAVKG
jgi:SAM-dependent methyltransferase